MEDMRDMEWVKEIQAMPDIAGDDSSSAEHPPLSNLGIVTDLTMQKTQQAYDALNVCVIAIRKHCLSLRGTIDKVTINAAMDKVKSATPFMGALEAILMSEKSEQLERAVRSALLGAAKEFQTTKLGDQS